MSEITPDGDYSIDEQLSCLFEVSKFATKICERVGDPSSEVKPFVLGLYQFTHDTHDGIWHLVSRNLSGPALSLLRVEFESYVRAYFFHRVAGEPELAKVAKTGKLESIFHYVSLINESKQTESEGINAFYHDYKNLLNAATHAGEIQLRFRVHSDRVSPEYPDLLICGLLEASTNIFFRTICAILDIFQDPKSKQEFLSSNLLSQALHISAE